MFLIEEPGFSDIERFRRDGFLVVERLIEPEAAARLAARFGPLFRGEFETGLYPDEWNWREGRDADDLTRQICNAWKSDRQVARAVLHPRVGLWCARLAGWPGARINQDNVLWKPPGARPLAFHQDDS
ncbi:MAG: phytanoyl-CoA dioxygenase family protein, partial [Alphaproteobacteria bacterium]|nr:phytanoyl-CoA dioxygenase family protein [Alphaproteobacteria bacterium]